MMDMYKIKLRYGGYFRLCKNSTTKRYCFGFQKCIHINKYIHYYDDLIEEVATHYPKDRGFVFSLWHIDIFDTKQSYIKVDSSENFQLMLDMYEVERELTVYVMTSDNVETSSMHKRAWGDVDDEQHDEEESEYSLSDDSDHSHYITDHEAEDEDFGTTLHASKSQTNKVNSTFENVVEFRRELTHYAIINEVAFYLEKSECDNPTF
ncbi:hypothetical protein R6Q59_009765 [Mikania micrantha]